MGYELLKEKRSDLIIAYDHTQVSNAIRRLTGRTDSSGSYTFYYDAQGNVIKEEKTINSILYTTEYGYNKDNVLTSITYPSGRTINYTLDVTGRTTQVDTTLNGNPKTLASSITYLPYGGIMGLTFGNTLSLTHGYDSQYRTSSIVVGSILDTTYNYDANGNVTSVDDGEAAGNETLENAGIYSYDQGTNLLADMWREVPVVYDYDEDGNTISANNRTFTYDLSNRLIAVQEGSTTLGQYVYNALNQRIKKTVQGQATIFHYDLQGHLIAETTDAGVTLAEYFYLGDQPLAMIRPGEALYYYHNDHLGTPQILTNDSATVSWKAAYTPFGEAEILVGTVENTLRFPGQYYDQETGLHYNWNRYYDPKTGRYLTPDPIGIEGGINLFVYVTNNPVSGIDPHGLMGCCCKEDRIEDIGTITTLIEAIQKNGNVNSKDLLTLIPNPSTCMIRLLNAMGQSVACKEMLLAKTCADFKNQYSVCQQELQLKYCVIETWGYDVPGALTGDLFDLFAKVKEKKVCSDKKPKSKG